MGNINTYKVLLKFALTYLYNPVSFSAIRSEIADEYNRMAVTENSEAGIVNSRCCPQPCGDAGLSPIYPELPMQALANVFRAQFGLLSFMWETAWAPDP